MKKLVRMFSAFTIASVMALTSSTFVFATPTSMPTSGSTDGTPAIKEPLYTVAVPSSFTVTVDPMEINEKGQIFSDPFLFVNKSNVPIEAIIKVTPMIATVTPKPSAKTEDEVLAASNDLTKTDKSFSMYIAPLTKSALAASGLALTVSTTDNVYASRTSYIGTGSTIASFNAVLGVSNAYTQPSTWAAPTGTGLTDQITAAGFTIVGSVNKNAKWAAGDVNATVSYQFAGMSTSTYSDSVILLPGYENIGKATPGTGATQATPRFRSKFVKSPNTSTFSTTLELGKDAATYVKGLADDTAKAGAFTVSAITVMKDGVADTTIKPAASDVTVTVKTTTNDATNPEVYQVATVEFTADLAAKLKAGNYTITALTIKGGTSTFMLAAENAGTTILAVR